MVQPPLLKRRGMDPSRNHPIPLVPKAFETGNALYFCPCRRRKLTDYFFDAASCSIARISAAVAGLTPPPPASPRPPAPGAEAAPAPLRPRPPLSPPEPTRSIGFLPLASTSSGLAPLSSR